jgi:uncharacterized membrane protein
MLVWIKSRWQNALRGFWLFPGAAALALALLAIVLVEIDRGAGPGGIGHTFDGDASAARSILTTVGATLITVAGLAFSITIVTVQLVSSQFSPRTLRSFLADRPSQVIAGAFVGIFAYCLLVLRTVREEGPAGAEFVPSLSVSVGIGLGLVGLVLLLVFIHRITQVIKVENIIARVAGETLAAIERGYPEDDVPCPDAGPAELLASWEKSGPSAVAYPQRPGYVRDVAVEGLEDLGLPAPAQVHVTVAAGAQVTTSTPLIRVWCTAGLDEETLESLRKLVAVERERDIAADVGFGIRQLADVALRALSPGVNDPTTAVTCIGYLQESLERLAGRRFPDRVRQLDGGAVLVVAAVVPFEDLVREPFEELGRFASRDARVAVALLDALAGIAAAARRADAGARLAAAAATAEHVAGPAVEDARGDSDRAQVLDGLARVRAAAGYPSTQGPDETGRNRPSAASRTRSTGTA